MEMERLGADDLKRVSDFLWKCWSEVYEGMCEGGIDGVRAEFDLWLEEGTYLRALEAGTEFLMYTDAGRDIGLAGFRVIPEERSILIDKLYLLPEYRGRGLGGSAMEHILSKGREAGCTKAFLYVNGLNTSAMGFYGRFGFTVADRRRVSHAGTEYELVTMRATIPPA